jgi:hypothetical protein
LWLSQSFQKHTRIVPHLSFNCFLSSASSDFTTWHYIGWDTDSIII